MANQPDPNAVRRSARIAAKEGNEVRRLAQKLDSRFEKTVPVQNAVTAGRNQVQIGGQLYPAEGVSGQGAAVAVVNVGTPAVAKYAPSQRTSVVGLAGTGGNGGGGGGGSGPVYLAGDAIAIDGLYTISVKRDAAGAIILGGGGGLKNNVGDGIKILSNALTLDLATDPALEYGTGGDAGKVRVKAYHGIERTSNGVGVKLLSGMTAMAVDANGLAIANAIAGAGLTINGTTKVVAVGAGDGIDVNADDVAVDVTDIINVAYGLYEPSSNDIGINIVGNTGLAFTGSNALAIGTPSSSSVSSSNTVTSTTHAHAVTTSSDVGTTPVAAILASNASGQLTLAQLTLRGNLIFAGGDRSITASNNLTIAPTTDLILDPTGLILLPDAQEMRTSTFSDLVTGISGMRFWDRGSNYRQLTIGAMKMDELYARVFVSDETRIDRGEQYLSKSFGVVETDFVLPAIASNVDVWFEDAAAMGTANLFSVGDWLLMRMIDWSTGIVVMKCWFTVESAGVNGYVSKDSTNKRQQWRLKRKKYGTTSAVIKKGNTLLDAGQVGQGWIHMSALLQDGGPFVQVGDFTAVVSDEPVFTLRTRMGNLNGTVDYSTNVYGFVTGNSPALTPSTGFSGATTDATNGLRIFNTKIVLYDGSTPMISMDKTTGINIDFDVSEGATVGRYIRWQDDLNTLDLNSSASLGGYKDGGNNVMYLRVAQNAALSDPSFLVRVEPPVGVAASMRLRQNSFEVSSLGGRLKMEYNLATNTGRTFISDGSIIAGQSTLHVYESSSRTNANAGFIVEQDGTGDAVQHFYLTGGQYFSVGIDNSNADRYTISRSSDLGTNPVLVIEPTTGYTMLGTVSGTPDSVLHVRGTNSQVGGITIESTAGADADRLAIYGAGNFSAVFKMLSASGTMQFQNSSGDVVFIFDTTTNRAGIMTTAPAGLLQVGTNGLIIEKKNAIDDIATANSAIWVTDGAAGGIRPNEGTHLVVQSRSSAARDIIFVTGAAERMTIKNSGDVGIGTNDPGQNLIGTTDYVSSRILQVDGTNAVLLVRGSLNAKFDLIDTGGTADQRWFRFVMDGNKSYLRAVDDDDLNYKSLMTFEHNTGAAGVGTITPSGTEANSRMTVEGSSSNPIYAAVINTGTGQAGLVLRRTGTTPSRWVTYIPSGVNGLRFFNDTFGDDVLSLGSNGYVGINESTQGAWMDVAGLGNGVASVRSTVYGLPAFQFLGRRALTTNNADPKNNPAGLSAGSVITSLAGLGYTTSGWATNTSAEIQFIAAETFNSGTGGKGGADMAFFTRANGASSVTERMRIYQDGGITMPDVYSDVISSGVRDLQIDSTGRLGYVTSALRYKEDVRDLGARYSDDFMLGLRPVTYKYKSDSTHADQLGFIAEEVLAAGGNELIVFGESGEVESLHYNRMIVPTVGAVQRLIHKVRELESRIAELEMRLN